jgi:chemotaxis protein CheC
MTKSVNRQPKLDRTEDAAFHDRGTRRMQPVLTQSQRHLLRVIFDRGAESASQALSKWLGHEVQLAVSKIELIELEHAADLLGPPDLLVVACIMGLTGRLTGLILLIFEDRPGLALVDLLQNQPVGTTAAWGELEESAVKETTNIVGCAYLNALAAHLPEVGMGTSGHAAKKPTIAELVPTPPTFVREFAGSLLQFALMDQALELDQILLIHSEFAAGAHAPNLNWTLLFIPSRDSLHALGASLAELESIGPDNSALK